MNLCDTNHYEVCFEGRTCPACSALEEKDFQIEKLELKLDDITSERDSLQSQLDNIPST